MRKLLLSFALMIGMLGMTTQKSHAIIGAVISAPAMVTVGGVMTLAGALGFAAPIAVNNSDLLEDMISNSDVAYTTLLISYVISIPVGLIGILVLDGDQQGELAFAPITAERKYPQFDKRQIATYNKQLSRLNAIQQTITAEVAANPKTDVDARWADLGKKLSPATIEIAALHAAEVYNHAKVQK